MIVLDASALAELLLDTQLGTAVARRISPPDETLHAPELLGAEIASVLRKLVLRGDLDEQRARNAIDELNALGIETYTHGPLIHRVLDLRQNLTSYDAFYMALAEALDAVLVTCDVKLTSPSGCDVRIELIR